MAGSGAPLASRYCPSLVSHDPSGDYLVALTQAASVDDVVSGYKELTSLATVSPPVLPPATVLDLLGPPACA